MDIGSTGPAVGVVSGSSTVNYTWPNGTNYSWVRNGVTQTFPCNENYLEYLAQNNWNVTMGLDPYQSACAIVDTSEDLATTALKSSHGRAGVADYTLLDQWYECYIAPLEDWGIGWRLYPTASSYSCDIPWYTGVGGRDYNGLVQWNTPATDAEADLRGWSEDLTNRPLNPAGNPICRSFESLFGNLVDYIETNCSKNFIEFGDEFQYTNQARFVAGATSIWYQDSVGGYPMSGEFGYRTQYPTWPGAMGGTTVDCEVYNPAYTGNPVTDSANGVHFQTDLERLQMIDSIQFECYTIGAFQGTLRLQAEVAGYVVGGQLPANFPMCQNYDTLQNINSDGTEHSYAGEVWWVPAGVGEPNNRHWWETMASVQDMNLLREKRISWGLPGAYDAVSWMQTGSMWPWNASAYDMPWWLSQADQLSVTDAVSAANINARMVA